ncbi:MAG: hypothetical protein ACI9G1_002050 [Pirellulaceae bacterium]|jgi:uncharacterized protein (DUF2126 family)/transglutaminase-like putative cysteine protease
MIRVALNHKSIYRYDRPTELGPQVVRLRPAPHCRTPIPSYSMRVEPAKHFINWQLDPHSNYQARLVFSAATKVFSVEVDLVAEMTVINPFDFFTEPTAEHFPFQYDPVLLKDLQPYLTPAPVESKLRSFVESIDTSGEPRTILFLVALNQRLQNDISYVIRLEPGVQSAEETLALGSGSCRDSAWLLVQVLRNLGLAARFVSGYLIQLTADQKPLEGPAGPAKDFTDLHAWTEVFLPGSGWIGLDPTSGLLAGEGHIPLASTPEPVSAAPITGSTGLCEVEFSHELTVTRIQDDPRASKPYTDEQWQSILRVGNEVDSRLEKGDVRLTMGGEPTFVSAADPGGEQWTTGANGADKLRLAYELIERLQDRFAPGGLVHNAQGKWYPGEQLPRWALTCLWRLDGEPLWHKAELLADPKKDYGHTIADAIRFSKALARRLQVDEERVSEAYEDALYYLWKENRLAVNSQLSTENLKQEDERVRLTRLLSRGLGNPVGTILPLKSKWWKEKPKWVSGKWPFRADQLNLLPGDSPMGLRLPLDSLPAPTGDALQSFEVTPFQTAADLPPHGLANEQYSQSLATSAAQVDVPLYQQPVLQHAGGGSDAASHTDGLTGEYAGDPPHRNGQLESDATPDDSTHDSATDAELTDAESTDAESTDAELTDAESTADKLGETIRTAMCFEPRDGRLHVFMPPVDRVEDYLSLLTAVEETAAELGLPVVVEGYLPPPDYRLQFIKVTPDPGVIEVNVHPTCNWAELVRITTGLYEDAEQLRLASSKFELNGEHTGTGGGNHIVLGGSTPANSPFLRRPDLLRSVISYWHNHPSLSYLFSGKFVGPTSQAPRVDEGRRDGTYELGIAMEQIPDSGECPPWLVDRIFRHLLVDLTGNTHRSEFCIDKLYSPDSSTGRLGLLEFRAFEMPPHYQMAVAQQLLIRGLISRFWEHPYKAKLADWNTSIHDRWALPHFLAQDFAEVIEETQNCGIPLDHDWFVSHFDFRFPMIGETEQRGIYLQLRSAMEPWYTLGEEPAGGATARYVDSSVERLQVKVQGLVDQRHVVSCNGRRVPLHPTGVEGEFVAGVRFRAWQPPSCLHPTIPVDEPLLFDILDTWMERSIGGCEYHVGHPGGLNPDDFPINFYEAECRRAARFSRIGHTGGSIDIPQREENPSFPLTLDLRRNRFSR